MKQTLQTQVLIIGGGVTGTGIARDLSMRGLDFILLEKQDLNAGASGGNHGLLHSGARYVKSDPEAAIECNIEIDILKRTAGHCIEETGGLFAAVEGDEEEFIADFPSFCEKAGIPCKNITVQEARILEPALSEKTIAAYQVNDASINPFKLSIENLNDALSRSGQYLSYCRLESLEIEENAIKRAKVRNQINGESLFIEAQTYVNASGAWAGQIASLADIPVHIIFSKGTLLVTSNRIARRVINRLRKPTDADILVPGGVVSILGTTSVRVESPDRIFPTVEEVDLIINDMKQMIPQLKTCRYVRAYSGVRPLVSLGEGDDREVSRGYTLIDHEADGVNNFITITGGKLSTYRLMAEKASDMVCAKHGVKTACSTSVTPLPSTGSGEWSEPVVLIPDSREGPVLNDPVLCECEMIPASAIDTISRSIIENGGSPDLSTIALRSRVGKGPCQGTFCSARILSYLYNSGQISNGHSLAQLRTFLNERWKGEHSLLWDQAIVQSSIKEMIHCGLFCLELQEEM